MFGGPGQEQPAGLGFYGDSHYGSGQAPADYQSAGHDTVIKLIPLRPDVPAGSPSTTSPSARTTAR